MRSARRRLERRIRGRRSRRRGVLGVRPAARQHARQRAAAHRRLAVRARQRRDRGHVARADGLERRAAGRRRHAASVPEFRRRLGRNGRPGGTRDLDPRELPGLQLHADEFGVGQRQIGRLDAEILADPLGLRLVSFESATDSFTAQGSGGWFVGDEGADHAIRGQPQLDERRPDARAARLRAVRRGRDRRGYGQRLLAGRALGRLARSHQRRSRVARCEGQPHRRRARRRRPRCGALEHQCVAAAARARFSRRVQSWPRVRRYHGRLRRRRRQRLHGQPEAHGTRGRGRSHRPHGAARPRLPPAGRRHGGARQGAADGRRAARRPPGCRRAPDLHAHLQEALGRHRPRFVLRDGYLG